MKSSPARTAGSANGKAELVGLEDFLRHRHRGHGLRPPRIERQVGDRLDQLLLARAVLLGTVEVVDELLCAAAGDQARDRHEAAVLRGQLLALPDLSEE